MQAKKHSCKSGRVHGPTACAIYPGSSQISEYIKLVYLLFIPLCYFFLGLLPVSSACLEFSPHTVLPFSLSTQCGLHFFSDFTTHLNHKLARILIILLSIGLVSLQLFHSSQMPVFIHPYKMTKIRTMS